jgi:hypothetical protein
MKATMNETFRYRAKPTTMILAGGFFALCGSFYIYKAITNDRGLIINGIIELGPTGATAFYAVLATLSALFVVVAVIAMVHGLLREPVLTLADDHIVVPGSLLRRQPRRIDFGTVTKTSIQSVHRQRFLTIWSTQGKVAIARSMLDSDGVFDRIADAVTSRVPRTER